MATSEAKAKRDEAEAVASAAAIAASASPPWPRPQHAVAGTAPAAPAPGAVRTASPEAAETVRWRADGDSQPANGTPANGSPTNGTPTNGTPTNGAAVANGASAADAPTPGAGVQPPGRIVPTPPPGAAVKPPPAEAVPEPAPEPPQPGDVEIVVEEAPKLKRRWGFFGRARPSPSRPSVRDRLALASIVGLLLAGSLVTTALLAGPAAAAETPDPCAGALRTTAEYQDAFARVSASGTGWVTADGYVPVVLPDGRRAWLMSDTLLGSPAVSGETPTFVHNSIVVQRGRCLTAVLGGTVEQRTDLVPEIDGRWCWQSAGVASGTTLLVFCTMVESADGPPGFAFRVVGSAIATFDLPGLTFQGMSALPFTEPGAVTWGTSVVRDRDTVTVSVYGVASGAVYVARVPFARVTRGPWTFWTGQSWGTRDAADAHDVHRRYPDRFAGGRRQRSGLRRGRVPEHPARPDHRRLDHAPIARSVDTPRQPCHRVDQRRTVRGRAAAVDLGPAGWTVVYNVNDPVAIATDPSVYGGRFVTPHATRSGSDELVEHGVSSFADGHVAAAVAA